mgnify:FL=1
MCKTAVVAHIALFRCQEKVYARTAFARRVARLSLRLKDDRSAQLQQDRIEVAIKDALQLALKGTAA